MLGNDIVDLQNLTTHPRYSEKICTPQEQKLITSSPNPFLTLWTLWAAKEATYKAVKKLEPTTQFHPKRFVCQNLAHCSYNDLSAKLDIITTNDYVHVTASFCKKFTLAIKQNTAPESQTVRQIAIDLLTEMGYPDCSIINIPPQVWRNNGIVPDLDLSLSHDGRYAAAVISAPPQM